MKESNLLIIFRLQTKHCELEIHCWIKCRNCNNLLFLHSQEGHKWLKSVHRYNDQAKPAVLAWQTVREIKFNRLKFKAYNQ